jgi:exosortase E/protease (VPEID-CTERM system)
MAFPVWAALALLFVEYLSFSAAFDATPLGLRADGWVIAGQLGYLAVLAASGVVGAALVIRSDITSARSLASARNLLVAQRPLDASTQSVVAAHLLSACVLWWLSAQIFAPAGPPPGVPALWLLLWALTGVAVMLSALAAAIPRAELAKLGKAHGVALALGAAIGVGAWLAGLASSVLWWPLGPMTLHSVTLVLGLVLPEAVSDPVRAIVGSQRFAVKVAPSCSGFEGIGMITAFAATYLLLSRRQLRFPRALLLIPLGIATAWVANVARLVLLVLVGTWISEEVAVNGFHVKAGWVFFCGVSLSLVLLVSRSRFFVETPSESGVRRSPADAYLLPFLVLVATALATGLFASHVDLLYGVRVLAVLLVLLAFRDFYRDIPWRWSWTAVGAGIVAAAVFVALAPRGDPAVVRGFEEEWQAVPFWGQVSWLVLRVVGSVLLVPLAEELAFRGYLLRRLVARDFASVSFGQWTPWAVLVSSAAFGAIHAGWLAGALAGLVYAVVQIRGRSLAPAVLAHVTSNAAVAIYVIGWRQWWLWT